MSRISTIAILADVIPSGRMNGRYHVGDVACHADHLSQFPAFYPTRRDNVHLMACERVRERARDTIKPALADGNLT